MSDISLFFHATLFTLFVPLRFRRVFGNPVTLSASTSTPALNKYSSADGAGADDGSKLKKSFSRFSFLLASDATKEEQEEERAAGPKSLGAVE